ncbi:hypothetical protein PQE68_gp140 [Bacillus phage vB_BanS_Sophrita]|uniref:DUF1653 domain-containing protein n=1 Tax=Bacillus phage vB_BanS_Sophrita TaxID=2894790 RepID=A0AAE9CE46_9CAUD|nr:hypothetical protein PQE68_gp140 [Bacillus phage vB_BanS_Sophrita]UGO50731.1 hypothetical protein SOPHRITA_140 [Bacillus phage vB_BanS_Sophrita]
MIYRHYKGGLYLMVGYATRISKDFNEHLELVAVGKHTETEECMSIYLAHDKDTGGYHYVFESDKHDEILCFYRDIDNNPWLQPRKRFFGDVLVDGEFVPRFDKVTGAKLFKSIGDLLDQELEAVVTMLEKKRK